MKESTKPFAIRKIWWLITVVLFVAVSSQVTAKPKTVKSLTQEAAAAYDKENYDEALSKFKEAYEMEPSTSLLYNMGRVCQSKGDVENALAYYREFVISQGADETATRDALERIEDLEKIQRIKAGGTLTQGGAPAGKGLKNSNASGGKKGAPVASGKCIDINSGSVADLTTLNGIGEKTAQAIVDSRGKDGAFKSVDDLSRIKGLGPKKIDKLRDQVCPLGGGGAPAAAPAPAPKPASKAPASAPAKGNSDNVMDI